MPADAERSSRVAPGGAETDFRHEFARQVENLARRCGELAGRRAEELMRQVAELEDRLPDPEPGGGGGALIPFVIVVRGIAAGRAMPLVELRGKHGFTNIEADDLQRFATIADIELPQGLAYLVTGVDTGRDTLNVTPEAALERIVRDGRSPLTIDEGVALVTHHPEALQAMNCFSILGSRCGDRRVTAMWLSGGRPRLGWCWAGNPHTWLGSASCASRTGV